MALAVTAPTNSLLRKPTKSLEEALGSFSDSLTADQRGQFQVNYNRPDPASVIQLVAQIDNQRNHESLRGVSPRLCTFLNSIQQFSCVVDTFVESNPTIAALIWGSVKATMLMASNVASYFDKVTNMIMKISKQCPIYQQFGLLFPGCVNLQRALCDYYALIVGLCTKIVKSSQREILAKTFSSIFRPFEVEFQSSLDRLAQASEEVSLQISLASTKATQEANKMLVHESRRDRILTASFRKQSRQEQIEAQQWRIDQRKRQERKLKYQIRDNLSRINHQKPWKQALKQRASSTAEWLRLEPLFCRWRDDFEIKILMCTGTIGTGKTVLMSNVVSQLHELRRPDQIICYYFCQIDDHVSLSSRSLFGSLARQILDNQIEKSEGDELRTMHEQSRDLDSMDVIDFILSHLDIRKEFFIILDGLDECSSNEIRKVSLGLAHLCGSSPRHLKILCAGRPELEEKLFGPIKAGFQKVMLTEERLSSDITCYIEAELSCCLREKRLLLGDLELIAEIATSLQDGSGGMFLWVRLVIEELCAQNSDEDILRTLKTLPRSLSAIFDRKLRRVKEGMSVERTLKMLQFCGVVKRPLDLFEYREILGFSPGQEYLDRKKLPNDIQKVIGDCCGFIFVDEEEHTVHYAHSSIKEYFFANEYSLEQFMLQAVDRQLGFLCMTYLNFNDFKRQVTKRNTRTSIAPLKVAVTAINHSRSTLSDRPLNLLAGSRKWKFISTKDLQEKVQEVGQGISLSELERQRHEREFCLLEYAGTHWISHLKSIDADMDTKMWNIFCGYVRGNNSLAHRPWEMETALNNDSIALPKIVRWLLSDGNSSLLEYMTRHEKDVLTEEVSCGIMQHVAISDRYRFSSIIIRQKETTKRTINTGLLYAARDGCIESLELLLHEGGNVNASAAENSGRTALQAGAENGHLEVVERLLAAKADVNASAAENAGRTALQAASENGHIELVEQLLAAKADVNAAAAESSGRTALQAAAQNGHLEVVRCMTTESVF